MKAAPGKLLTIVLVLGAGCAQPYIDEYGQTQRSSDKEYLRQYAEEVFRRQNKASDSLAVVEMSGDPAYQDALSDLFAAEWAMLEACAPLNEIAVARRDDRRVSPLTRRRVAISLPDCDLKARELQNLLAQN